MKKIKLLHYYVYTSKHHNLFHVIFCFLVSESKSLNSQILLITTFPKAEHRAAWERKVLMEDKKTIQMSDLWHFRYSSFMFADSFLDSLFPGSLSYLVTPFTHVSFGKKKNIVFYLVLTACTFSLKNSYWGVLTLRYIQDWSNLLLVFI